MIFQVTQEVKRRVCPLYHFASCTQGIYCTSWIFPFLWIANYILLPLDPSCINLNHTFVCDILDKIVFCWNNPEVWAQLPYLPDKMAAGAVAFLTHSGREENWFSLPTSLGNTAQTIDIECNKRLDHRQLCFEALFAEGWQAAGIKFYKLHNMGINTMKTKRWSRSSQFPTLPWKYIVLAITLRSCVGDGLFWFVK